MPADVSEAFAQFPRDAAKVLQRVRKLVFEVARADGGIGPLTETLKWGEPAYLTEASKSGSTVRLGWKPKTPDRAYVYFNCNTGLVVGFRRTHRGQLAFDGRRAIVLPLDDDLPEQALRECIEAALTYHRNKAKRAPRRR